MRHSSGAPTFKASQALMYIRQLQNHKIHAKIEDLCYNPSQATTNFGKNQDLDQDLHQHLIKQTRCYPPPSIHYRLQEYPRTRQNPSREIQVQQHTRTVLSMSRYLPLHYSHSATSSKTSDNHLVRWTPYSQRTSFLVNQSHNSSSGLVCRFCWTWNSSF